MSGFKMDDYVDVAQRIADFSAKYPDGSLQSELEFMPEAGGWFCRAFAYRSADDARPGIGHAFEPVPGKTPYTKDSEAMNAETSAWGRAIVALGFNTKKIASRQEVAARQSAEEPKPVGAGSAGSKSDAVRGGASRSSSADPHGLQESNGANVPAGQVELTFGKHKGTMVKDAPRAYLEWWVGQPEPNTDALRRQRAAVQEYLALDGVPAGALSDDDIPF